MPSATTPSTPTRLVLLFMAALAPACARDSAPPAGTVEAASSQTAAVRLHAGVLRPVNRDVAPLADVADSVRVSSRAGSGIAWVEGSDFADGELSVDVRGKDVLQQSFVGIAFHGTSDEAYEAVYLRPFNFRATDPARHQHAVQYVALPDYDWPRLRQEFPEEFENPVDASLEPTGWVPLRVVVKGRTVQIFAGTAKTPALEVRRLGTSERGLVGLWVGNNSDGDFANLRITPMK